MRKLLILAAVLALSACGKVDRAVAGFTGWSESCVNGVAYIQFTSGSSAAYTPDGKIKTCTSK